MNNIKFECAGATLSGKYVLPDAVRWPCPNIRKVTPLPHVKDCWGCSGSGWTPATDGFTWLNVLPTNSSMEFSRINDSGYLRVKQGVDFRCTYQFVIDKQVNKVRGDGDSPEASFFVALFTALKVMGANFLEVDAM